MFVASRAEMREIEALAVEELDIELSELMEQAGMEVADEAARWLETMGRSGGHVTIVCGKGNNGGDGFVAARYLKEHGFSVTVFSVCHPDEQSREARAAYDRLEAADGQPIQIDETTEGTLAESAASSDLIIDALFGFGFRGEMGGAVEAAAIVMNSSGKEILAVDVASGTDAESGRVAKNAVKASRTLAFTCPMRGQALKPARSYGGELRVADIGIPLHLVAAGTGAIMSTPRLVGRFLPHRSEVAHKHSCGKVLVVAGSLGLTGAAAMASEAALRSGAGIVTLAVPASLNPILEAKMTEVMTVPLPEVIPGYMGIGAMAVLSRIAQEFDVLALGPGLGQESETAALIRNVVSEIDMPIVLDADGLNALATPASDILRACKSSVILTPHVGEFGRLTGLAKEEILADPVAAVSQFSQAWQVVIVLKGANSIVAAPTSAGLEKALVCEALNDARVNQTQGRDRTREAAPEGRVSLAINTTGNAGLATAGTGDILTGLIAGLKAQGLTPYEAALLGTYLHGSAGDEARASMTEYCMTATDLLTHLPRAIQKMQGVAR